MPPSIRLPHPFPPRDQADVPCCVSVVVTQCMEVLDALRPPAVPLSPLFHYFAGRPIPGVLSELTLRDGFQLATRAGVCSWALHPYPMSKLAAMQAPSQAARADALQRRIAPPDPVTRRGRYWLVQDSRSIDAWRVPLAKGMPLGVGLWLTQSYWALRSAKVHPPVAGLRADGGHAVTVIGYDDPNRVFVVKDSRGEAWGEHGHWLLPYDLVPTGLFHEVWALERISYD